MSSILSTSQAKPISEEEQHYTLLLAEANKEGDKDTIITAMNHLADVYVREGRLEDAEALFDQALELTFELVGQPVHPKVAKALHNMARIYRLLDRQAEAKKMRTRAKAIEDYVEMEFYFKNALSLAEESGHNDDIAETLNALASLYLTFDQSDRAEPLLKRSLKIQETLHGLDNPILADTLKKLGQIYMKQGPNATVALPFFKRAVTLREATQKAEPLVYAQDLEDLAQALWKADKAAEAEPMFLQVLSLREAHLPPTDDKILHSLKTLAGYYTAQGRLDEVEPYLTRVIDKVTRRHGAESLEMLPELVPLATLYKKQHRYEEAEALYQSIVTIQRSKINPDPAALSKSILNLAGLYYQMNRLSESEPLFMEALTLDKNRLGAEHPDVLKAMSNLAAIYFKLRRFNPALAVYQKALKITKKVYGPTHLNVAQILSNIAKIYFALGQVEIGHEFEDKAHEIQMRQKTSPSP